MKVSGWFKTFLHTIRKSAYKLSDLLPKGTGALLLKLLTCMVYFLTAS